MQVQRTRVSADREARSLCRERERGSSGARALAQYGGACPGVYVTSPKAFRKFVFNFTINSRYNETQFLLIELMFILR
ncbi:MAG TPA: hypothetical protein VN426_17730 [Syntrophomonadaceae bacterium]|nr:hypothetical protein [Syntrophomonadaceae bacterium]